MGVEDSWVPEDTYREFIAAMPEACVDVVVEHEGEVLVARRENEPAKGEWFWPGSRLFKGEALEEAARRVAREELGLEVEIVEQLGANAHVWDTSEQDEEVGRHTVVVVYRVRPTAEDPEPTLDDQHSAVRWLGGTEDDLHEYVTRYLERWELPRDGPRNGPG